MLVEILYTATSAGELLLKLFYLLAAQEELAAGKELTRYEEKLLPKTDAEEVRELKSGLQKGKKN